MYIYIICIYIYEYDNPMPPIPSAGKLCADAVESSTVYFVDLLASWRYSAWQYALPCLQHLLVGFSFGYRALTGVDLRCLERSLQDRNPP